MTCHRMPSVYIRGGHAGLYLYGRSRSGESIGMPVGCWEVDLDEGMYCEVEGKTLWFDIVFGEIVELQWEELDGRHFAVVHDVQELDDQDPVLFWTHLYEVIGMSMSLMWTFKVVDDWSWIEAMWGDDENVIDVAENVGDEL